MPKTQDLNLQDTETFFDTLISLTRTQKFRTAWTFLENNVDPDNTRVYDAGVLLQDLSNNYGDIGPIHDECVLRKELNIKVNQVISHLIEQ